MGLFHRKLRMTPQELGLGLFHGTIFDRSPHLGSIKHATGRFLGCQGLELQEERVRRELLLLALAVVDMQLSHAMNHGTLQPSDSSDVLTTYMGALCTFELKIPETDLYELMRDRLPIYYKALNDWLSSTDSQQRQVIGPVERTFAAHCGVPEPLKHEGFASLCRMEVACQADVVASILRRVKIG